MRCWTRSGRMAYAAGMNAIPFDTLKMARKLEASGFSGDQAAGAAEAMAEAMAGAELAAKADLLAVKTDVLAVKADVLAVRTDLLAAQTNLENRLDSKLEILRRDMTIRLGAMLIACTGILLAAIRFVTHP